MTTTPELLALRDLCARIVSREDLILSKLDLRKCSVADTSPAIETILRERYAVMSGSERALMALQTFETAQHIVLSSLPEGLGERARRRELCRRFYGEDLARRAYG
jgi:hypothetical protein